MISPEHEAMHQQNFKKGATENARFWARLGGAPDFTGKRVLDVGCGLGSLCISIAEAGAAQVYGFEIEEALAEFADTNLRARYSHLASRVKFMVQDICTYDGEPFDVIVSKDAFEHIIDLPNVLKAIERVLKPGGKAYICFGPLYYSPLGDHGRLAGGRIPWLHALLPESLLLQARTLRGSPLVSSVEALGLNKYTTADYQRAFAQTNLKMLTYEPNKTERVFFKKLLEPVRAIPAVEKYVTFNTYCVAERPRLA